MNVDMLVYHTITQHFLMYRQRTYKVPRRRLVDSSVWPWQGGENDYLRISPFVCCFFVCCFVEWCCQFLWLCSVEW